MDKAQYLGSIDTLAVGSHAPLKGCDFKPPVGDETADLTLRTEYSKLLGQLGWVANMVPAAACPYGLLAAHASAPTPRLLGVLRRTIAELKVVATPLVYKGVSGAPQLVIYSDASYDIAAYQARSGYQIQLLSDTGGTVMGVEDDNLLTWRSRAVKRKVASTTSAELIAFVDAVKAVPEYEQLIERLWGARPAITHYIDSEPLLAQLVSGRARAEPRLQGMLDYAREQREGLGSRVVRVGTHDMRADRFTKVRIG
jgi:hypothetical protein